jgi:hypothetical protein
MPPSSHRRRTPEAVVGSGPEPRPSAPSRCARRRGRGASPGTGVPRSGWAPGLPLTGHYRVPATLARLVRAHQRAGGRRGPGTGESLLPATCAPVTISSHRSPATDETHPGARPFHRERARALRLTPTDCAPEGGPIRTTWTSARRTRPSAPRRGGPCRTAAPRAPRCHCFRRTAGCR